MFAQIRFRPDIIFLSFIKDHGKILNEIFCSGELPRHLLLRLMVLFRPPHPRLILFVKLLMRVIRTTSRTITCPIYRVTAAGVTCHVTCNQRIATNYSTSGCSFQDYKANTFLPYPQPLGTYTLI